MNNYSILVVDDEELLRESLARDLRIDSYNVSIAGSGDNAIELLKNHEYDLILTDLMMEGANGIEVLECAKDKNNESMVIIITGYGSMETAIDALQLGAADYIIKPYNKKEMSLRITRCLEKLALKKKVKLFEDILPVCCKCSKTRDDTGVEHGKGEWMEMEAYVTKRAGSKMSHGYCKECYNEEMKKLDSLRKLKNLIV